MIDPGSQAAPALPVGMLVTQVLTFFGVVAGLLFTFLRDGRTRKWLKEDRAYAAQEIAATAAALARHTADVAAKIQDNRADLAAQAVTTAKILADHTTEVGTDLKVIALTKAEAVQSALILIAADVRATKDAAGAAYKEANHVNLKLEALGIAERKTDSAIREAIRLGVEAEIARRSVVDKPDH